MQSPQKAGPVCLVVAVLFRTAINSRSGNMPAAVACSTATVAARLRHSSGSVCGNLLDLLQRVEQEVDELLPFLNVGCASVVLVFLLGGSGRVGLGLP